MNARLVTLLACAALTVASRAQEVRWACAVTFRVGCAVIDTVRADNAAALAELSRWIGVDADRAAADRAAADCAAADSVPTLRRITVVGFASPEGATRRNRQLATARREAMATWLRTRGGIADSLIFMADSTVTDWAQLATMVAGDTAMPDRDAALRLLVDEPERTYDSRHRLVASRIERLQQLSGGRTWRYMHAHFYPQLRTVRVEVVAAPTKPAPAVPTADTVRALPTALAADTLLPLDTMPLDTVSPDTLPDVRAKKTVRYGSLHTNALSDLLLLPNVGGELYLGRSWSVAGNWTYGWWQFGSRSRSWRAYGGHVAIRRWVGRAADEKPLTGHHIGLYGQVLTYDVELDGTGYMAGHPGGNLFDEATWGAGVEYGLALPLTRRLNVDFTLGVGYLGGTYYEYRPIEGHRVWQATKERRYVGPTRVEASLVYLLGRDNVNAREGGAR